MSVDTAAKIDRKTDELRAATRAANEALADLKAERKALETDINEFRQYMQTSIHDRIEEAVGREFERLGEDLKIGRDRALELVMKSMDDYWRLMIGADRANPDGDIAEAVNAKFDDWEGRIQRLEGRRREPPAGPGRAPAVRLL